MIFVIMVIIIEISSSLRYNIYYRGDCNLFNYEKLKCLRKDKKLTQKKLAGLSNVSQSTISEIESGRVQPSLATVEKLAKALDVTVNVLIN